MILIKLKNIKEPNDLKNKSFKEMVKENTRLEIENLDDYIVVLDGLDELAMKTGLSTSDIELICQKFSRESTTIIITTRHGYLNFDTFTDKNIAVIELKELDKTQQLSWLEKYKTTYPNIKLSNETIEKFHKDEDKHILELINQPILLHMIAKMNIENIEELNKTTLYSEFFEILIKRKWENDAHTLSNLKGIDQEEYSRVLKNMLKELAFEIFNSENEYIQKYEFEKLESVKELQKLLSEKNHNESLKSNLKGVMVSFYFKEVKKDEEDFNPEEKNEHYAIEFLHKSLMEYMVASYIYDYLKDNFLETKRSSGKYIIDDGKDALEELWYLFHQKQISNEVINNLVEIIEENNQDINDEMAKRFDKFLPYLIEKDFLLKSDIEDNNPIKKAKNTFYGFWEVLTSLDNKNHMPEDKNLKQKLFNEFVSKNRIKSNLDLSNIHISDKTLYLLNSCKIDFNNTFLIRVNILSNIEFTYDVYLENLEFIFNSTIHDITFYKLEFMTGISLILERCVFDNIDFGNYLRSQIIFKFCTFINCKNIDIEEMNKNDSLFIHCTKDGEKI